VAQSAQSEKELYLEGICVEDEMVWVNPAQDNRIAGYSDENGTEICLNYGSEYV
jgi:hypothetical protein